MEESNVQLTFKCPVKWNDLPASTDGRYCAVCEKNVKDFTGTKADAITADVIEKHECGSFKATQLYRPFGDKRDVLIGYYQKLDTNTNRQSRKILFMLVTVVLFITGCHSRRMGGYAKYTKNMNKKNSTETVSVAKKQAGI